MFVRNSLKFVATALLAGAVVASIAAPRVLLAQAATADPFAIPESTDNEAVQVFVQRLIRSFQTRGEDARSPEGTAEYLNRMDAALDQVQQKEVEAPTMVLLSNVRGQILGMLVANGDETAQQRSDAMVARLKQSADPEVKAFGEQLELSAKIAALPEMEPAAQQAFIEALAAGLGEGPLNQQAMMLAQQAADRLVSSGNTAQAVKAYELFAAKLESRNEQQVAPLVAQLRGLAKIAGFADMQPEQRTAVIKELAQGFATGPLGRGSVELAEQAADALEGLGHTDEAAAAYNEFANVIEARGEEQLAPLVENFRGTGRRVGLMGHPIEIKGTTVDGKPFDIKDWKGKVVLVDFWATWCGPCIQELPNVRQNYDLYHAKGFEVVGISLDDNPQALTKFIKDAEIPWITLFPEDEAVRGWENPIARHYGISGIPTVILVNQEGNVVSLNARGAMLGALLADLLGPADAGAGDAPPADPAN
ncbi:MAG: TlpA disulfide reductase family protein [Planctomycetaceae bacterium]